MKLLSKNFKDQTYIPAEFTCDGENISPHLVWVEVPEETKYYALILEDPDAPSGMFIHWMVINIPQEAREIHEGHTPQGEELKNDTQSFGYSGPCPPSGTHRYIFTVYALKDKIRADNEESFRREVDLKKLDQVSITGFYSREKRMKNLV